MSDHDLASGHGLLVTTKSGAAYLFESGLGRVMRLADEDTPPLRKDGEWMTVVRVQMMTGQPMILLLDGVAPVGLTERKTTAVVSIERAQ